MRSLFAGLLLTVAPGSVLLAAPVPKEAKAERVPPAPDPEETFFHLDTYDYGTVIAVGKATVTLKPKANRLEMVTLPDGREVQQLRPIDETPRVYQLHPVMKDGGISDLACGSKSYLFTDVKLGDTVHLYNVVGKEKSRWLTAIEIVDRPKGELPKPMRSHEEWRKISGPLYAAYNERQQAKAKEDAAKNDKK